MQVRDLEHQAASDKLEKQIDAQRKSNDDWKRRRDQNEEPKRIFQTKLTRNMIHEVFNNEIDLLENIRTGKKSSARHKMFKTSAQSCQALGQQNYTHILSKEQVQWVCEEMDKKWMDQDYNWKVLVPEFCVSLYAHFFNTSREIAERKILETGAGIYGLTRSSSGEFDLPFAQLSFLLRLIHLKTKQKLIFLAHVGALLAMMSYHRSTAIRFFTWPKPQGQRCSKSLQYDP